MAERGFTVPNMFWFCVPVEKGFLFQMANEFVMYVCVCCIVCMYVMYCMYVCVFKLIFLILFLFCNQLKTATKLKPTRIKSKPK